jgi:hypothetical protein
MGMLKIRNKERKFMLNSWREADSKILKQENLFLKESDSFTAETKKGEIKLKKR